MIYPFSQTMHFLAWTIREREIHAFQTCSGSNQIQMLLALYSADCKNEVKKPKQTKQESLTCKNIRSYGKITAI